MNVRFVRPVAVFLPALLAACAGAGSSGSTSAPAPEVPKPFEYAAGTATYRFTQTGKTTQSFMGQSQDVNTSASRVLSVTIARGMADTMALSVVLDSMNVQPMPGMPTPDVSQFVGKTYGAKMSPAGAVYSVAAPAGASAEVAAVADELGRMMPRVKGILSVGHTWVDTLDDSPVQGPLSLKRRQITTYKVAADTTFEGERAWKIGREVNTQMTGTGNQRGQALQFESVGAGKGTLWMSRRGVLLGGDLEDNADAKVLLTGNNMELGMKMATFNKVAKIK